MDANKENKLFWGLTVGFAFAAMISFFQINSYHADKHHLNGLYTVLGIAFTLASLYSIYRVSKVSNTGKD